MLFILHRFLRFLCGFIPALPMIAAYHFILRKRGGHNPGTHHVIATYAFCLYISSVFFITDIPDLFHFQMEQVVNLVPFDDLFTNTVQYFLNILIFVPFGFMLPMLWGKFEKKQYTFLCGLMFSLFIETIQLFNYRATDIDDLLMNTVGAIAGYFLFVWIKRIFPRVIIFSTNDTPQWRNKPFIYGLLVWASIFFVQPVLSRWLLGLIFDGRVMIG